MRATPFTVPVRTMCCLPVKLHSPRPLHFKSKPACCDTMFHPQSFVRFFHLALYWHMSVSSTIATIINSLIGGAIQAIDRCGFSHTHGTFERIAAATTLHANWWVQFPMSTCDFSFSFRLGKPCRCEDVLNGGHLARDQVVQRKAFITPATNFRRIQLINSRAHTRLHTS